MCIADWMYGFVDSDIVHWIKLKSKLSCLHVFEGFLWGSIHLLREEVDHYSLQLKHDGQCLQVALQ